MLLKANTYYHQSFHICERNNYGNTYVYNSDKEIYIIDEQLKIQQAGRLIEEIKSGWGMVSFHPEQTQAAVLTETEMVVADFAKNILWRRDGKFCNVLYSRDGKLIWTAEKIDKNQIFVSVFDSQKGNQVSTITMEDELYDSALRLSDIPASDTITLEFAAGQDGIFVRALTLTDDNRILNQPFTDYSFITPAWKPDGTHFFTLENDASIFAHFRMGTEIALIKEQEDPDFEDEELAPGYSLLYLKNGMVLTQNMNNRCFLFNQEQMERGEEVVFKGYEPVPVYEVYKNLKDEDSLYSRIVYFQRIGKVIVARTGERDEKPVMLLFDEDDFIRQLASLE